MMLKHLMRLSLLILFCMSPFAQANIDWSHFKARFLMTDGRIVDTGNHNISHTEGQGVGMLFAVKADDRASFDRIWNWTKKHLRDPQTKLFYWRYNPIEADPIVDKNDASDGDTLIAWALLKAGQKWRISQYINAYEQIAQALVKYDVIDFANKKIMLPGMSGFYFNSYVNLNPSYFIFPAWRDFARYSHLMIWWQLINDAQSLMKHMAWGASKLPTDWVSLYADGSMEPAHRWPARMSYDAIRIPLYIKWDRPNSELLKPWRDWFARYSRVGTPAWVNVYDNQTAPYVMKGGLLAVRDLTMDDLSSRDTQIDHHDDYYSATLKLLAALATSHR